MPAKPLADKPSSQVIGKQLFVLLTRQDRQGFGLTRPARRWRSLADMAVLADMVVVGGHVCNRRQPSDRCERGPGRGSFRFLLPDHRLGSLRRLLGTCGPFLMDFDLTAGGGAGTQNRWSSFQKTVGVQA